MASTAIEPTARNSDCQFCSVACQKSALPMYWSQFSGWSSCSICCALKELQPVTDCANHEPIPERAALPAVHAHGDHARRRGGGHPPDPRDPTTRTYRPGNGSETDELARELDGLLALAARQRVAIMCAEAVWWRCHRSLIADALVARGESVLHVLTPERAEPHVLREFARVEDGRVTYPGEPELF